MYRGLICVLAVGLVAVAQPREREITGQVTRLSGAPLAGVQVCAAFWQCTRTDERGHFQLVTAMRVVRFSRAGYEAYTDFDASGVSRSPIRLDVTLRPSETSIRRLRRCEPRNAWGRYVGTTLKVWVPRPVIWQDNGWDVDFRTWSVGYGLKPTQWMLFGGGMSWTTGLPSSFLKPPVEVVSDLTLLHPDPNQDERFEFFAADIGGRDGEGKRWRHVGGLFESITYYDASDKAAAFFDRLLESLCFSPRS